MPKAVSKRLAKKLFGPTPELFPAGVPPLGYFLILSEELGTITKNYKNPTGKPYDINYAVEVCFIGLAAYFEAFCKAHFAILINICPEVLNNFLERRKGTTVSLSHLLHIQQSLQIKLGSLIAEDHDFGSAKTINSLFQDLLRITPFSTDEARDYDKFLADRNLLVHHGGVYTFGYASQRLTARAAKSGVHWQSLVIGKAAFGRSRKFIEKMATKIASTSQAALKAFVYKEKVKLSKGKISSIELLTNLWDT